MNFRGLPWLACVVVGALTFVGCSDDSKSSEFTGTANYTGPGSFYDLQLDNDEGTFTLAVKEDSQAADPDFTVTGSFVRHDSGFLTFTVEEVDPEDAPEGPTAGDTADGFEIPGYAFILKPTGSDENHVIPMLISGECPTADFDANWLIAQNDDPGRDASDAMQDWFGTFSYDHSESKGTVSEKYSIAAPDTDLLDPNEIDVSSCDGGLLHLDEGGGDLVDMWLTKNGAMVHAYGAGHSSTILALPRPSDALDLADFEGTYSGLVVQGAHDDAEIFPVKLAMSDDGTGSGSRITDIETDATESEEAEVELTDAQATIEDGWFTGTISIGADTGNLACAGNTGIGSLAKNLLFCIGQSPDTPSNHFILLFVSR